MIKMLGYEDLFSEAAQVQSGITEISIDLLDSFRNHPFKVLEDEAMEELVLSIREQGVINPILVRKALQGRYEIIAGHRRTHASRLAGHKDIPAIIKELSDEEATVLMVDTNIQRYDLLPSEKAFAYKMRMDAMKKSRSQPGARTDELLASQLGTSRNQVQRFIRLTYLNEELLTLVDLKKIGIVPGEFLSYLSEKDQRTLADYVVVKGIFPSLAQAQALKQMAACRQQLTMIDINSVLGAKKENPKKVILKADVLTKYFPGETSEAIEKQIIQILEERFTR